MNDASGKGFTEKIFRADTGVLNTEWDGGWVAGKL